MAELQDNLPPGWDCKTDEKSGNRYYINHFTKTTTWEDPRNRHRPFHSTPIKHLSNMQVEHIPLQEMRSIRISPLTVRGSKVQDTSLTNASETDEAVSKIAAMFPTVSDTHIRLLMKKYHNREALVISALQVEKYPITTPGPFATPPPQRNIQHYAPLHATPPLGGLYHANSRGGSPIYRTTSGTNSTFTDSPRIGENCRSSPRPHSSPKLKLRYMKSIFPQADETVILDVLQNNDNNIQKTSDGLKEMGFAKKDTVKVAQQKVQAKKDLEKAEEEKLRNPPTPVPKLKTVEEKAAMKIKLQEQYKDVADHLITIALESVDFDESRANQILQIMVQEDSDKAEETEIEVALPPPPAASETVQTLSVSQSRHSIKSLLKSERSENQKCAFNRVIEENSSEYKSANISNTTGSNPGYIKGANEKLLLEDYVRWQGPNTKLKNGSQSLAKGSNSGLLSVRSYSVCGSNAELRKGPKFGLAKGSMFSQLKSVLVGRDK